MTDEISHQEDLCWYLTVGLAYFERSTFGAQLDALVFEAYGSRPCGKCDGIGVLNEPWVMTHRQIRHRDGERESTELKEPLRLPTGANCPDCKGRGCIQVRLVPKGRDDGENALTARPKSLKTGGGNKESPPDSTLTRYALVSRRLSQMPRVLAAALVASYGDEGEDSSRTGRGRAWAATPLTLAGQQLLERHRKAKDGNDSQFRAVRALTELADLDGSKSVPARKKLLAEAAEQATRLVRLAEESWNSLESRVRA